MPIRSQKGFSIVELAVMVAMTIVLGAVTYPHLASLTGGYRLETAGRNLATDLQKTRFRAIAEGYCFRVVFDASAKTYQVQKHTAGPCATSGTFTDDGPAKPIDFLNSISISSTGSPIFTTRGNLVTGTESTITLTGYKSSKHLIGVTLTGRVNVRA